MASPRLAVVREALALERLAAALETETRRSNEGCGALCSFVGVVRATNEGRQVRHLEYEAFEPLAVRTFEVIAGEIAVEWPSVRLALHHRVGRLAVGEASVVIVTAGAHRDETFRACRYAIERVKQIAPVWKREFFEDGDHWVEGATADPGDEDARSRARAIACT